MYPCLSIFPGHHALVTRLTAGLGIKGSSANKELASFSCVQQARCITFLIKKTKNLCLGIELVIADKLTLSAACNQFLYTFTQQLDILALT